MKKNDTMQISKKIVDFLESMMPQFDLTHQDLMNWIFMYADKRTLEGVYRAFTKARNSFERN